MVKIYWVRNLSEENTSIYNDTKFFFEDKSNIFILTLVFMNYRFLFCYQQLPQ